MPAPPARTEISDNFPNPSNAVARAGLGKFYDYVKGLLGSTGNTAEAHAALATQSFVQSVMGSVFAALGFTVSWGTSWYVKFPSVLGGVVIQGGTIGSGFDPDGGVALTYPMAFPNACRLFIPVPAGDYVLARALTCYASWNALTTTGCSLWCRTQTGTGAVTGTNNVNVRWIAVGN